MLLDRVELCRVLSLMWHEVTHIGDYVKNSLICSKVFSQTSPGAFSTTPTGIKVPWHGFLDSDLYLNPSSNLDKVFNSLLTLL